MNPRYVILGTSTLLVKDGSFYTPGDQSVDFHQDNIDLMIQAGAARPVQVGDMVTIHGLTLKVTAVVE